MFNEVITGLLPTYLLAPVAIALISATLALLISLTDRVVNNYGQVSIDINHGKKQLAVTGGASLLTTLSGQGIFIPSACGGRGSCGACKLKVNSDIGPLLPTELPYLDDKERASGVRLSCQVKLKHDIGIEIPEALFNIHRLSATVSDITELTHDIKQVQLTLPPGKGFQYIPGQYLQLEVPAYDQIKQPTMRAYSLSSTPSAEQQIEFLIRLVPGGIVTSYVHQHLQQGDKLKLIGPFGDFQVQDTAATMICVAGGSGMAPFKSIFNSMIESGEIKKRDIWYFFGARSARDMFYLEWLRELNNTWERFHFIPALSEPQPDDNWSGATGLITEVLKDYLDNHIPRQQPQEGYLCGSPGMLDACMGVMRDCKLPENSIYYDKFA